MSNDEILLQDNFNQALLEAIEDGLSLFGNLPREAVMHNLETHSQPKAEDLPLNLANFEAVLNIIFGSGSGYLKRAIAKKLYKKFNVEANSFEDGSLVVCVDQLRRKLLCVENRWVEKSGY